MNNLYTLELSQKNYQQDQDKNISPEETYANAFNKLREVFPDKEFILSELISNSYYSVYSFSDGALSSHGKGATKQQAMASAIMEFIERKSWLAFKLHSAKGFIQASYNDLIAHFDLSVYNDIFNVHYFSKQEETSILLKETPLYWVEAFNMTKKKATLYPINFFDLLKTSNGLAAGNSKEEAITQGICELIEREHLDNFLLDPYNNKIRIIEQTNLENTYLLDLLQYLNSNNIEVTFFDISNSLPVTTILAHLMDNKAEIKQIEKSDGYGAHLNPEKAMIRALTEAMQSREISKKNIASKDFELTKANWQGRLNIDFKKIISDSKSIKIKNCVNITSNDFYKDIEKLISILQKKGHELIALNITHPLLQIPTFRLTIPSFKTGDEFSQFSRNEYYLITYLIKNSGNRTKAWEYYQKHKKQMIEINEETKEMLLAINKHLDDSLNMESFQNILLKDDILYNMFMPKEHINLFKFHSYIKNDMIEALNALTGNKLNFTD
jgi:ribosomal protein S12 methylthiotransferase accessory factor